MLDKDYLGHRDRLRSRYLNGGIDLLQDYEILELLLFYAIPRKDTKPIAHRLIKEFGSLSAVFDAPIELLTEKGLSQNSALFIKLLPDLCRVYYNDRYNNADKTVDINDLINVMAKKFIGKNDEYAILLLLDAQYKEVFSGTISSGSITGVNISIQKIITTATKYKAVYAVLAHNHPSGNALPSNADIAITKKLIESLRLINIILLDHIIVSDNECLSFSASGILDDIS